MKSVLGAAAGIGKALGVDVSGLQGVLNGITGLQDSVRSKSMVAAVTGSAVTTGAAPRDTKQKTQVVVDFRNLPKGTRVESQGNQRGLDMSMGYANVGL